MTGQDQSASYHVLVFNFLMTAAGWWFVAGVAVLVVAVRGAAYKVGNDIGKGAADTYDAATKMNFSQLSKDALAATTELRRASTEFSELVSSSETAKQLMQKNGVLTAELATANSDLETLRKENSELTRQVAEARSEINKLESVDETTTIKSRAGGDFFAQGNLFMSYSYFSRLQVNGKEYNADEGTIIQVDGLKPNTKCTLLIKKISPTEEMTMSIACGKT